MSDIHPHIDALLNGIQLEELEEVNRYKLDATHSLRQLKSEGLALHPIRITHRQFGFADYPEFSFRMPFPADTGRFKDGVAIECFCIDEEPVKGVLLSLDGRVGEIRLYAPDYPEWLESDGVGVKLAPDQRTHKLMKDALLSLSHDSRLFSLFKKIHGEEKFEVETTKPLDLVLQNKYLNESQIEAIQAVQAGYELTILHGPPGTGKTTTLIESILHLAQRGEKILVSAPSNAAVDHIANGLLVQGLNILRVGNAVKISEQMQAHTLMGKLSDKAIQKEIKQLRQRAEEFRKMALKYKRSFGKAEREQRNLLFKEVKTIRGEIRKLLSYYEEKFVAQAQVVLGTPVGLLDSSIQALKFDTLFLDEAGQCLEPLAWCIFPLAEKIVLAGDHFQLPPTVLSAQAIQKGFNISILQMAIGHCPHVFLLNTQYRMREAIAGFSSKQFYENRLLTPSHLQNRSTHLSFIDTAGAGMDEKSGPDGQSLVNEGELNLILKWLEEQQANSSTVAFISPYAGQVAAAKELLPHTIRISTIDSFQGQEHHTVIVSLVRSNADGDIGFLKDTRRMNVALTRAQERLVVIGDSATLGGHEFYKSFLNYVENHGEYRSVWEFALD
jgi:ATP-dependent RNA/DNA helicase IGHMBP2